MSYPKFLGAALTLAIVAFFVEGIAPQWAFWFVLATLLSIAVMWPAFRNGLALFLSSVQKGN